MTPDSLHCADGGRDSMMPQRVPAGAPCPERSHVVGYSALPFTHR